MARKKSRQQDPADSSDSGDVNADESVPLNACKHISKGVQLGAVKKKLKNGIRATCDSCAKMPKNTMTEPQTSKENDNEVTDESFSFWLCLSCAHVGCGRGQNKHALAHYSTPRSEQHDLVVDIDNWIVWCYTCEQKMAMNSTKKLQECVEYIRRHMQTSNKLTDTTVSTDTSSAILHEVSSTTSTDAPTAGKDLSEVAKSSVIVGKETAVTNARKKIIKAKPTKVRGLANLGNTCFYNSVLQCLSVTPYLKNTLEKLIKSGEMFKLLGASSSENIEAPAINGSLGESGPVTRALLSLLIDMGSTDVHGDVLFPRQLLKHVQDVYPQFRGNEQHDAHELLRHLLEGVRTEDLKRFQRVILEQHGLFGRKNDNVASDVKKRMKFYGHQLQDFILGVEGIFKGQLVSIVECQDCRHHSARFESFLDLSLPVMEDKPLPPMRKKEQMEGFGSDSAPSKYQAKKLKKAAKRNNRAQKARRNEKLDGCLTILEETVKGSDGPESEQSDADVEDNVEQDTAVTNNDKEVVESGYSSEKQNTGESDGTSPSIMTAHGEGDVERSGDGRREQSVSLQSAVSCAQASPAAQASASPCQPESPTAPVSVSASSGGPSPTLPTSTSAGLNVQVNVQDWSTFHTPEHDCVEMTCNYNCKASVDMRCFTPIDEELRITIPESGEGSIHISPVNPSDRPVTRCDFLPGGSLSNSAVESGFTPELESRLLSLCLDENKRSVDVEGMTSVASQVDEEVTQNNNNNNEDSLFSNELTEKVVRRDNVMKFGENKSGEEAKPTECVTAAEDTASSGSGTLKSVDVKKNEVSEWCKTLAPRPQSEEGECSIISCLNQFTSLELMTGNNKVGCEACTQLQNKDIDGKTVYTNSTKQFLISSPPPVLILHLKRFMMDNFRFKKLQRFVSFPLDLDIGPYCSTKCKDSASFEENQTEVRYSLFGVVEHTGSLNTGHYIAYIKVRSNLGDSDPRWSFLPGGRDFVYPKVDATSSCSNELNEIEEKWYSISDSRVVEIAEAKVLKLQAYLLFYERTSQERTI